MDMQTVDLKVFLKSLTEVQAEMCESDEKQLAEIFNEGWSEATSVLFHRAMLHGRGINPTITVEGVFEEALHLGLSFFGDEKILARLHQARADDVVFYGIERRDGKGAGRTACTVSPDVAALAKQRRNRKVRGV